MSILTKLFIFTETTQSAGIATDAWLQTVGRNLEKHLTTMNEIAIKYNQKRAKIGLVLGLILLLLYGMSIYFYSSKSYFPLVLGIAYISMFFYKTNVYYLRTENGFLKKDFGPKIRIKDIVETRRFAGDYIFKSKTKTITIDKNAVDKSSVDQIENFINQIRGVS